MYTEYLYKMNFKYKQGIKARQYKCGKKMSPRKRRIVLLRFLLKFSSQKSRGCGSSTSPKHHPLNSVKLSEPLIDAD